MEWEIIYFNETVKKTIEALPKGLYARFLRIATTMQIHGPNLGMPHTRAMGDRLFEIRLKAIEGIARVFYCSVRGNRIYLLHSIRKKTQTTPKKDLNIAKRRMKEINDHE